jgi:xylulokinase
VILGIGFSGQMHGLVFLDRDKRLLRPAIIWADQRGADLLEYLSQQGVPISLRKPWGTG